MNGTKRDWAFRCLSGSALAIILTLLSLLLLQLIWVGLPALSWTFLTTSPNADMSGGIWPAIVGTVAATFLMTIVGVPIGMATGIYLNEYAPKQRRRTQWLRVAIHNLANVPSIVVGLFGLGFFVLFIGQSIDSVFYHEIGGPIWGKPSLLWASLTLALFTLPVVIVGTEDALRKVPSEMREASLALGATRFQTLIRVTLPHAKSGILSAVIISIARASGEVAPLLFCGAANYLPDLPNSLRDMFMHLGYHVFALATQSTTSVDNATTLYATVLVLLLLTLSLNLIAIILRVMSRRQSRQGRVFS